MVFRHVKRVQPSKQLVVKAFDEKKPGHVEKTLYFEHFRVGLLAIDITSSASSVLLKQSAMAESVK